MKTIIKQITYMCPTGLGNPNATCRFHRLETNLPIDGMCPTCKLLLVKATHPEDKITLTVMGEEDIDTEISKLKEKVSKGEKIEHDLSTPQKEIEYKNKRKEDIRLAILEAKKLED